MGKRKLCGTSFWQCDWTGIPMKSPHCYMPAWGVSGKLVRKGAYCNWEAVVAHATWLRERHELHDDEFLQILAHVEMHTGTAVRPAPHYELLAHTKGQMTAEMFHLACVRETADITGVLITPNGDVGEVTIEPDRSSADTGRYIFHCVNQGRYHRMLSCFHSVRKGNKNASARDLCVFHYPDKDLPHNPTASNLFKMQLYGDVLLVQQSREASFMPRERYVSYTKATYEEQFVKKRKKPEPQSMSVDGYGEAKAAMQNALNAVEQAVTKAAVPPKQMSTAQSLGPKSGATLAEKVKERGRLPSAPVIPAAIVACQ
jgi:hypothetical protein